MKTLLGQKWDDTPAHADPGDAVRLPDGLVHLCAYVSFNDVVHFPCSTQADNTFTYGAINKEPVTCVICATWTVTRSTR